MFDIRFHAGGGVGPPGGNSFPSGAFLVNAHETIVLFIAHSTEANPTTVQWGGSNMTEKAVIASTHVALKGSIWVLEDIPASVNGGFNILFSGTVQRYANVVWIVTPTKGPLLVDQVAVKQGITQNADSGATGTLFWPGEFGCAMVAWSGGFGGGQVAPGNGFKAVQDAATDGQMSMRTASYLNEYGTAPLTAVFNDISITGTGWVCLLITLKESDILEVRIEKATQDIEHRRDYVTIAKAIQDIESRRKYLKISKVTQIIEYRPGVPAPPGDQEIFTLFF